jgi:hypothetical protein
MSCCSTVFFGTNGMALARRLALRRSGFAWRFKDGSAPTARLSCLISDPCGFDAGDLSRGGRTAGVPPRSIIRVLGALIHDLAALRIP